jgi:hypothetical protein
MSDFPKYPTDFAALIRPFEDEEIETLLSQKVENVALTIDILKTREVNASNALQETRIKIEKLIQKKEAELKDSPSSDRIEELKNDIAELEHLLF